MDFFELFAFFARVDWLIGLFFIAGFILVIVEMFYPGFGVPGIAGCILLFLGVILLANSVTEAVIIVLMILAIIGIMLIFVLRSASRGRLKNMVLSDTLSDESGFRSTEDFQSLLGKEGVAVTVLRPSGTADFDGIKLDVVSRGEFIPKGSKIKVLEVEGRKIIVSDITGDV